MFFDGLIMKRDLLGFDVARISPIVFSGLSADARIDLGCALSRLDLPPQVAPFGPCVSGHSSVPGIALLTEGYVRQQFACESGRTQIATLLMPGDLIETGHDPQGRLVMETATEARLWVVRPDRAAVLQALHPSLCQALAELRAIKLGQARWLSDALSRLSAEERVVCFLVLATRWMPYQPISANAGFLTLDLPRLDMANLLASSVETISRVLARLDREGLIEIRGAQCFRLRDLAALCAAGQMAADWRTLRFARPGASLTETTWSASDAADDAGYDDDTVRGTPRLRRAFLSRHSGELTGQPENLAPL